MSFSFEDIKEEAEKYTASLEMFLKQNNLEDLFKGPVDHLAVKLYDGADYERFLNEVLEKVDSADQINMGGRSITSVKLRKSINIGKLGKCNWLEIMEPKPENVGKDLLGFDHIEIVDSNLNTLQTLLSSKVIDFEYSDNGHHCAVVLSINEIGQRIKFTDKSLAQVLEEERAEGLLEKLL